jgi:hypothetical protein
MKKLFWGLLIVLFAIISISFAFIRNNIEITGSKKMAIPAASLKRGLLLFNSWNIWWNVDNPSTSFFFSNPTQSIAEDGLPVAQFQLSYNGYNTTGLFEIKPINADSCTLYYYTATICESYSLIIRLQHFFRAIQLKKLLDTQLEKATAYYNNATNIYGITIVQAKVKDSTLISTKIITTDTPSATTVYKMIANLETYISQHQGTIQNMPMLNITRIDTAHVHTMVAIPLLQDIPTSDEFIIKKMILGNILETNVIGDNQTIAKGFEGLKNYASDYRKLAPAIPFQSLLTNRLQEKDSTKWKTRLSYPVY